MLPKVLDTKFLNEKATKSKMFIKKIKQLLALGEEEFKQKPMYLDRSKYYLITLFDELEQIACHFLEVILQEKSDKDCLKRFSQENILHPKLSRALYDVAALRDKLIEKNMLYTPENMYYQLKDIITTLDTFLIPELSKALKEVKEKQPKLKIPVNLKRINQHISAINSNLSKLNTFFKYSKEEFLNSPMFIDRSRYYIVVITDSTLWICKHILRKLNEKPINECFQKLVEKGIIDKEVGIRLQYFAKNKDKIANPTIQIDIDEFYEQIKENAKYFKIFVKQTLEKILDA